MLLSCCDLSLFCPITGNSHTLISWNSIIFFKSGISGVDFFALCILPQLSSSLHLSISFTGACNYLSRSNNFLSSLRFIVLFNNLSQRFKAFIDLFINKSYYFFLVYSPRKHWVLFVYSLYSLCALHRPGFVPLVKVNLCLSNHSQHSLSNLLLSNLNFLLV